MPRRPPPRKLPISSVVRGTEGDGMMAVERLRLTIHWVDSLYRLATVETVTVDKFIADAFFFYHGRLQENLLSFRGRDSYPTKLDELFVVETIALVLH